MSDKNELPPNYLMTGKELQEHFGVSFKTVKRWMKKGIEFPVTLIGKSKRFNYSEVKKFFSFHQYTNMNRKKRWATSPVASFRTGE